MKLLVTAGLSLAGVGVAWAQPPVVAVATEVPVPDSVAAPASPLTFYGFVDAYYGYDFGHGDTHDRPAFLYSHDRQNEFTVNNAVLGLRYQDERVRGALGLHAGSYVVVNYAAEEPVIQHVYEAYAGFRPFRKAWLDVGIFTSHIGFESALSQDNWTLTRSLMAENSPYFESGARLTYEVSPPLTLTALVLNGWQNIRETNQSKAVGTQVQWKPAGGKWVLNSSSFYGNEQPRDSLRRRRLFHDFYGSYAATQRLSLALVFDIGQQQATDDGKRDTWHAGAAFLRYQLAPQWTGALRAEYYQAERGVVIQSLTPAPGAAAVTLRGASLNLDYAPARQVLVRLEGRLLAARHPTFPRREAGLSNHYGNITTSVTIRL
ncbi:porin [Hymenobacter sp. BT730]|uniref:porin n=1 Tax=Hymenobacter sp. BT730 TaxID=3063332 RepID=UPI0026DF9AC7|nr:porin [Hymenobacter sp. BT730]